MADLRDEEGNPIQLTDEHGNPVQLTDEHGNPMHLTGIATSPGSAFRPVGPAAPTYTHTTAEETGLHDPTPVPHTIPDYSAASGPIPVTQTETKTGVGGEQLHRSSSSSSSSSEDDGHGGRRKKGLKEKIKERFSGGKHKDTQTATTITTTNTEHEKKSLAEKIKEKLPGHHAH